MPLRKTTTGLIHTALWCALLAAPSASASITDFGNWTRVEDPPHAGLTATTTPPSTVTLSATGAIPGATDIGYQSIDGGTVATSSAGYYFSPASDFSVAVDFELLFSDSVGAGGIGFGIGEDGGGANSAGIGIGFLNGTPLAVSGASRVDDSTQPLVPLDGAAVTGSGRLFIDYDSASGNVDFGINATPGSAAPTRHDTLVGIQDLWDGEDLLVSLFLRSEQTLPLSAGAVSAVFSNFAMLQGTAQTAAVPLPAGLWLMASALLGLGLVRRRQPA